MALLQLPYPIYVKTELGDGQAIIVESDAIDNYWWVKFPSGAVVTFPQEKIKVYGSYTYGDGPTTEEMKKVVK